MQGASLLALQELSWTVRSGISQLDAALVGGAGFTSGIYDFDAAVDVFSAGVYELVFTAILSVLASGGEVLFINDQRKVPWFKLTKQRAYKSQYAQFVHEMQIDNLVDLIVLFKNNDALKKYKLIVINAFGTYYTTYFRNMRHMAPSAETTNKFTQGVHKLFHLMQRACLDNNSIIFTIGSMKTFSQEIRPTVEADTDTETTDDVNKVVMQKILVPVLSLSAEINVYYTNRIVLYRDWVHDSNNPSMPLVSGLPNFEESVQLLTEGRLRSLPHWRCFTLRPHAGSVSSSLWTSGFFLVDNSFNIVDIDRPVSGDGGHDDDDDDEDDEIPDSQVYYPDFV